MAQYGSGVIRLTYAIICMSWTQYTYN